MICNLFIDYEHESVGRALVVYAIFSTFACTPLASMHASSVMGAFSTAGRISYCDARDKDSERVRHAFIHC